MPNISRYTGVGNNIGHPLVKPVSIVNTYSCVCTLYREEKTEQLIDAKNEIERLDAEIQKLKQEVSHQDF